MSLVKGSAMFWNKLLEFRQSRHEKLGSTFKVGVHMGGLQSLVIHYTRYTA